MREGERVSLFSVSQHFPIPTLGINPRRGAAAQASASKALRKLKRNQKTHEKIMLKTCTPLTLLAFDVLQKQTSPPYTWAMNANRSAVITLLCALTYCSPIIPSQRTPIDTWHLPHTHALWQTVRFGMKVFLIRQGQALFSGWAAHIPFVSLGCVTGSFSQISRVLWGVERAHTQDHVYTRM